jgi:hypothetical protein
LNFRRAIPHPLLAWTVPAVAYVALYLVDGSGFHPSGDGFYSWIYARSLAFDGDLHFANDYALCGDPFHHGFDRGGGRPDNPFYVGPAVFWTPVLFVLRLVGRIFQSADAVAASSCTGWLPGLTILTGPLLAATTVLLSYFIARRFVKSGLALVVALIFAFSSPLFPYATSVAHYSHVYLTFAVAALVHATLWAADAPRAKVRWAVVGMLACVCVLSRLPAAIYLLFSGAAALLGTARLDVDDARRAPLRLWPLAIVGLFTVAGFALTSLLYLRLYGTVFAIPQGEHYLQLARPHPLMLLFGVHGGFFFWTPFAWLSVLGIVPALRRKDTRLVAATLLVSALLEIYLSSAPLEVYAGWSIGARRLLPLFAALVFFGAIGLAWLGDKLARFGRLVPERLRTRAPIAGGALIGALLLNNVPVATLFRGDVAYPQAVVYGAGWSPFWAFVDDHVGDVAILPAEIFFSLRWQLPIKSYREGIRHHYIRKYRTLKYVDNELLLSDAWVDRVAEGFTRDSRGLTLKKQRGRLVLCIEWPHATHIGLRVTAEERARLHLTIAKVFTSRAVGGIDLEPGEHVPYTIEVPPGAFDSGMLELLFDVDPPAAKVTLETILFEDRVPRKAIEAWEPGDP